jgi:hypothetical protein
MLIRDLYHVETDAADWPYGLTTEDKQGLQEIVKSILLGQPQGLETWLLHDAVRRVLEAEDYRRVPSFRHAVVRDWTFGAVVRACRATDCEERWYLPKRAACTSSKGKAS